MLLNIELSGPSGNSSEFEIDVDQEEDEEQLIKRLLPAHAEHQKTFSRMLIFVSTLIFVTLFADYGGVSEIGGEQTIKLLGIGLPYKTYLYCFTGLMVFLSVPYASARARSSETFNMITGLSGLAGNGGKKLLTLPLFNGEETPLNRHNFISALMHGGFHSVKVLSDNAGEFNRVWSRRINRYVFHPVMSFLPVIGIWVAFAKLMNAPTPTGSLYYYLEGNGFGNTWAMQFASQQSFVMTQSNEQIADWFILFVIISIIPCRYCWNSLRNVWTGMDLHALVIGGNFSKYIER